MFASLLHSLLTFSPRTIRDQATKTVDIYLARIRKYTQSMPDTVLPSPSLSSTGGPSAPRMGTPANDTSWAGWAISSFTNKLTAASGEIQSGSNGTTTQQQRPSSVPPPASAGTEKPALLIPKPGMALPKHGASIPSIVSPDPAAAFDDDAEDFGDDWGGFGEDDTRAKIEDDPWSTPATATSTSTSKGFDDKGEPDFAGWLTAQSQAKKTVKNPLPKGLSKTTATKTTRPAVGARANTTGSTSAKKVVVPPKKETPKVETKKEDEEDGWGDAW